MNALDVQSVTKQYGSLTSLSDVSLQVAEGEFFGLLGPNGAGKTTLISIIAGLTRATRGKVKVMGCDVLDDFRAARKQLGMVPQELVFDPFFTVRETLRFQSGYFGLNRNDSWIDELLHELNLTDKANSNMRSLSGGMKRRVLVAQALVHRPPLIVLDEPTAGVDVELRQTLWRFVARLNREGHTVLLTTHYLEEAEALCHRIAMLKLGKIVKLDTTAALLAQHARQTLSFKLSGPLPAELVPMQSETAAANGALRLTIDSPADIERILATCRTAGLGLTDLSIEKPDLEDVFVRLMHSTP
ncbi:MAG: ATP-binding cassette domain-containing protein [Burkholderiaceae bacterium]|jgi:ABC-2 type transport system ATP-binding protein